MASPFSYRIMQQWLTSCLCPLATGFSWRKRCCWPRRSHWSDRPQWAPRWTWPCWRKGSSCKYLYLTLIQSKTCLTLHTLQSLRKMWIWLLVMQHLMTVINVVFRERKVPWVLPAVMAFKVLLVFLVRLVLRVPLERTVTRWSQDVILVILDLNVNLGEQDMFKSKARTALGKSWNRWRHPFTSTYVTISSSLIWSEQCSSTTTFSVTQKIQHVYSHQHLQNLSRNVRMWYALFGVSFYFLL